MCVNCATAAKHFSDGTTGPDRPLQTSVEQGTSPDWHAAIGPAKTIGEKRADQVFSAFDDENYLGI